MPLRSGSGDQQADAAEGVRDHQREQRELTGDRAVGREEAHGAVVGGDDTEDVTGDDRGDLEGREAAGAQERGG